MNDWIGWRISIGDDAEVRRRGGAEDPVHRWLDQVGKLSSSCPGLSAFPSGRDPLPAFDKLTSNWHAVPRSGQGRRTRLCYRMVQHSVALMMVMTPPNPKPSFHTYTLSLPLTHSCIPAADVGVCQSSTVIITIIVEINFHTLQCIVYLSITSTHTSNLSRYSSHYPSFFIRHFPLYIPLTLTLIQRKSFLHTCISIRHVIFIHFIF